jgi:pantothenate kinase
MENMKGIPKDILASSFGKCSRKGSTNSYKEVDIMKSLLISFTVNLG